MKPSDHPEFYRLAPPPGTSRESTIRLDREGRFWHDGAVVENDALVKALHSWINRHPDNGRYILTNGYDWTYFTVDDAPYFITSISIDEAGVCLVLSDDSQERMRAQGLRIGADGALYASVKNGKFEAKFTRHAQAALAPLLHEGERGEEVCLHLGGQRIRMS